MNITQRRFNHLTIFFTLCFLVVGPLTFAQALKQHDEFEKLFTHIQQSCCTSVQSKLAQITFKKRQLFERLEKLKLHAGELSSEELAVTRKLSNWFRRLRYRVGFALESHSGNSRKLLEEVSAIFCKFRRTLALIHEEQMSFDRKLIPDLLTFMSHMINTVLKPANLSLLSSIFSLVSSHKGKLAAAVLAVAALILGSRAKLKGSRRMHDEQNLAGRERAGYDISTVDTCVKAQKKYLEECLSYEKNCLEEFKRLYAGMQEGAIDACAVFTHLVGNSNITAKFRETEKLRSRVVRLEANVSELEARYVSQTKEIVAMHAMKKDVLKEKGVLLQCIKILGKLHKVYTEFEMEVILHNETLEKYSKVLPYRLIKAQKYIYDVAAAEEKESLKRQLAKLSDCYFGDYLKSVKLLLKKNHTMLGKCDALFDFLNDAHRKLASVSLKESEISVKEVLDELVERASRVEDLRGLKQVRKLRQKVIKIREKMTHELELFPSQAFDLTQTEQEELENSRVSHCSICFEDYNHERNVQLLSCCSLKGGIHVHHMCHGCYGQLANGPCPFCRQPIKVDYDLPFTEFPEYCAAQHELLSNRISRSIAAR